MNFGLIHTKMSSQRERVNLLLESIANSPQNKPFLSVTVRAKYCRDMQPKTVRSTLQGGAVTHWSTILSIIFCRSKSSEIRDSLQVVRRDPEMRPEGLKQAAVFRNMTYRSRMGGDGGVRVSILGGFHTNSH
ncbi:hypothetical protein JOB18_032207 [Solea senegalensis]|uniref:Uncharacterized protein n=1 Tax=Solea senegalensis TaxID=28829 RepID=A0AAV6T0F7_SOLSE|nr:hypothetical protein JOB18_032207 [Solea senegalensis]